MIFPRLGFIFNSTYKLKTNFKKLIDNFANLSNTDYCLAEEFLKNIDWFMH